MVRITSQQEEQLDARNLSVRFSPPVQEALRSIAAASADSNHFDHGIQGIVEGWSNGKPTTVHDVMIALPAIAREVTNHVEATHDSVMKEALDELCMQLPENGFTVARSAQRRR
jgi:hypothetical protein